MLWTRRNKKVNELRQELINKHTELCRARAQVAYLYLAFEAACKAGRLSELQRELLLVAETTGYGETGL